MQRKYFFAVVLIAAGTLIFQNCGQTLQANGDPYELDIQIDPILDGPSDIDGTDIPNFSPVTECSPTETSSQFYKLSIGISNDEDTLALQIKDGRYKLFNWSPLSGIATINSPMTSELQIVNVEEVGSTSFKLTFTEQGTIKSELFSCM